MIPLRPKHSRLWSGGIQSALEFTAGSSPEVPGHHSHLYVGSATADHGGLVRRKGDHERKNVAKTEPSYHHNLMVQKDVPRKGQFFIIVVVQTAWQDLTREDFSATRKLCIVAEAVYTAFFRAFYFQAHEDLKAISP